MQALPARIVKLKPNLRAGAFNRKFVHEFVFNTSHWLMQVLRIFIEMLLCLGDNKNLESLCVFTRLADFRNRTIDALIKNHVKWEQALLIQRQINNGVRHHVEVTYRSPPAST